MFPGNWEPCGHGFRDPRTLHTEESFNAPPKRQVLLGGKFQTKNTCAHVRFRCHCTRDRLEEKNCTRHPPSSSPNTADWGPRGRSTRSPGCEVRAKGRIRPLTGGPVLALLIVPKRALGCEARVEGLEPVPGLQPQGFGKWFHSLGLALLTGNMRRLD